METNEISTLCTIIFVVLAVIHTGFYTFWALKTHEISLIKHGTPPEENEILKEHKISHRTNIPWLIHQRWFNGLGASTSWLILWTLLPCLIQSFSTQSTDCISIKEIILFLISLIGLSGYLPLLLFGIARSANELANMFPKP